MSLTKAAAGPDPDVVRLRPEPDVWSAIEYACHVRDVLEVQRQRIAQCLAEDRPVYAPMDRTGRVKQAQVRGPGPDGGRGRADAVRPRVRRCGAGAHAAAAGQAGLYNYPVRAPRTLGWVIRHTAHEIQHHRQDITTILARVEPPIVPKPKEPARGAGRGVGCRSLESASERSQRRSAT